MMIRHLVHLKFCQEIDSQQKQVLYERLAQLCERIEGAQDFQYRVNVSVETPLVRGFVDMFWFDFSDTDARDHYLVDAEHQAIGADIVACLEGGTEGVFVCDIEL